MDRSDAREVAGAPATARASSAGEPTEPTIEQELQAVAMQVNKDLPKMIDSETRFDRATVGPGLSFTYQFTLLKAAEMTPSQVGAVRSHLSQSLRTTVCDGTDLTPMLQANVTINYLYVDNQGARVMSFPFDAKRCAASAAPAVSETSR
ncbi:MAG TPA: hypothetical protein VFN67_33800 [Polyangiales bacterium]|nr:hypothetical protein [Polyangiales bacterium]